MNRLREAAPVALQVIALTATLFLCAGRIDWLFGWLFVGAFAALSGLAYLVVLPGDPELASERRSAKKNIRGVDRVLTSMMAIYLPVAILVVAGYSQRFGWSPVFPVGVQVAGLTIAVAGYLFTTWAVATNTFFSSAVRIQEDRGHRVISDGPYRYVRHPGYAGFIFFWAGSAVLLGSPWSLIPAAGVATMSALRILLEEKTLRGGLDGYEDYTQSVRYRVLPGVW
jgi:protein-S-isoprenylcysteine O-methyltransferase Ste14